MSVNPDPVFSSPEKIHAPSRRPGRWIPIFLGFVIFFSGVVLGGSGALILQKRILLHGLHHPEKVPGRLTEHMQDKLKLTDVQAEQILEILTRRQQRLQELQREVQPRFEAEFDAVRLEIIAVLDPDQAGRYDEWYAKVRKTWTPSIPKEEAFVQE